MKVEIHELAVYELRDAIDWNDSQLEGLGKRFKSSVNSQVTKIKNHPTWFPKEDGEIYKAYIPKFPYKILFIAKHKTITILAIAHLHRKPCYWQMRTI
jgi:hypothetical protein